MDIIPVAVKQFLSLEDAFIAIYILAIIGAIEAGIIGGLATRVGSLRNLFRLTASVAEKRAHDASNKKDITHDHP
jgi:hypothetical protein